MVQKPTPRRKLAEKPKPSTAVGVAGSDMVAGDCIEMNNEGTDVAACDSARVMFEEHDETKLVNSKSDHRKSDMKISKNHADSRNLYKEAKQLENECNEITPQLTSLEHEMKQSEERTLYQIRTLKMNLNKCDQEYQRATEANEEVKKKVAELDYRILNLDLHCKLNEQIHKSALLNMNRELTKVRSKLLELGRTMNGLWENTRRLADFMMPKEKTESRSMANLKWIFRPITAVHNSLSTKFSLRKNNPETPADISCDVEVQS